MVSVLSKFACLLGAIVLVACVNQAGDSDPYRIFKVTEGQEKIAREKGLPYVTNRKGNLQTIEAIDYHTEQFGVIRIEPGFNSDGSSRPFDNNLSSIRASILHDAMYRGTEKLNFLNGYPGPWTKAQADSVYCLQLLRLGAPKRLAETNCRAVRFLQGNLSVWGFHKKRREAYWSKQGAGSPN